MMRQEESEPVCIVNGCGRSALHRVGECAPDDAPTYSDGAEVQAQVDDAGHEFSVTEDLADALRAAGLAHVGHSFRMAVAEHLLADGWTRRA